MVTYLWVILTLLGLYGVYLICKIVLEIGKVMEKIHRINEEEDEGW